MAKDPQFILAKQAVLDNLDTLETALVRAVEEGMIDLEDEYYNEILGLIKDVEDLEGWAELLEAITKAKTLEMDVAGWLSRRGRTSISLPWPKLPK